MEYWVYGDSKRELKWNMKNYFNLPNFHGIHTDDMHHELAEFAIETGQLYLTNLTVEADPNKSPTIDGVTPVDDGLGRIQYINLKKRIIFTGAFVFGDSESMRILNCDVLFRANCIGGSVKGVENFSEQVITTRQHVNQLKKQFYQEDSEYSKTSKQKRLLHRNIVTIHNEFCEQIYGSTIHNYPLHLDIRIKPSNS